MDKENVVHIHNGVLCSRENNGIMKFAGKWMELENVILSEFQKATNDKKQLLRLAASENSIQKVLKTETQGINAMQVADALRSTSLLLTESHEGRLDDGQNKGIATEDENLRIASRMVWFNQPRPPDSSQTAPVKIGPSS
ncbi:hypothetical protein STEG23_008098 [Scotinomys teguina]